MNESLAQIVDTALEQSELLADLDPVWREAWASDLLMLAAEVAGETGETDVRDALDALGQEQAIAAIDELATGAATCESATELVAHREVSIALRCSYDRRDEHYVVVDLVAGLPETIGEVHVAAPDLLDALAEHDAAVEVREVELAVAAHRIAAAISATDDPRPSAVANGRLLLVRLRGLVEPVPEPLVMAAGPAAALPPRDPEDNRYTLNVFRKAVAPPPAWSVAAQAEVAEVAERLRAAAGDDAALAVWLAASDGPVDLDEADETVVVHALAATIAPQTGTPLSDDQRRAVAALESVDWLGALIELMREGAGAVVDPDGLVDRVNRCPEVTTSIPKRDRARVAWAFGVMCGSWPALGVLDEGRLTETGAALLPRAVELAWRS